MIGLQWLRYLRPGHGSQLPTSLRLVIAAVSGAALSFSFTGYYLAIYSWICLGILLIVLFGARPVVAFGCGFLHGFSFCIASVPWIATVLAVHGGLSRAGGWGVLLLIAAVWGILIGIFGWAVHRLSLQSVELACIGAPFIWISFEFVRAHIPEISFPWNLLGYPASNNLALLQISTVTGIYGVSFLVASFNSLLAWTDVAPSPRPLRALRNLLVVVAALLVVMFVGPKFVPQQAASHLARSVQLNFPEALSYQADWFGQHISDMNEVERLSLTHSSTGPDLLVWPEAPAPFSAEDAQFAKVASSLATRFRHPFLAGVIDWRQLNEGTASAPRMNLVPYNSAMLWDMQGQRQFSYDKIHLVPFGEYEPFPLIHQVVNSVSEEVGGFRKGKNYSVGTLPGGYKFGVFICYEAIYPGEIRNFAANGAELLINISNDGWFGRSAAPEQHLRMARVRAVESRRWMIRSTNNGFTASVDPYGRINRALPPDIRAAVDVPYDFRTDRTIYTRFGDWFAWLCVVVSIILVASTFWKGNLSSETIAVPVEFAAKPVPQAEPA